MQEIKKLLIDVSQPPKRIDTEEEKFESKFKINSANMNQDEHGFGNQIAEIHGRYDEY